jgi:hypothetical protein
MGRKDGCTGWIFLYAETVCFWKFLEWGFGREYGHLFRSFYERCNFIHLPEWFYGIPRKTVDILVALYRFIHDEGLRNSTYAMIFFIIAFIFCANECTDNPKSHRLPLAVFLVLVVV